MYLFNLFPVPCCRAGYSVNMLDLLGYMFVLVANKLSYSLVNILVLAQYCLENIYSANMSTDLLANTMVTFETYPMDCND